MSTRNLRNIERTRIAAQVRGHQRADAAWRHVAEWLRTVTERTEAHRLDVIEREVAHAVALERERVAAWLENNIASDWSAIRETGVSGVTWDMRFLEEMTPPGMIAAIRNGAHDGAAR